MVKPHAWTELDHSRGFGRRQRVDRNAQMFRRAEEQRGIAHRFGRGDEQQPLGRSGERLDAPHETFLDLPPPKSVCPAPETAGKFCRGDISWHLEQGQRNAARLRDDAVAHPRVDPPRHHGVQQLASVGVRQAADDQFR